MAQHRFGPTPRARHWLQAACAAGLAVAMSISITACSSPSDNPPPAPSSPAATSASPTTAGPSNDAELFASLTEAIRSANPAMSPKALDAHIRRVTNVPRSLIVAPYDPKAESESSAFMKTWVASHGIDGASASHFSDLVYRSGGKPFHTALEDTLIGTYYVAGQPIEVGGAQGYVLVGTAGE